MKDAIKMISLDDIGDMGQDPKTVLGQAAVAAKRETATQVNTDAFKATLADSSLNYRSSTKEISAAPSNPFMDTVSKFSRSSAYTAITGTGFTKAFGAPASSQRRRLLLMAGALILLLAGGLFLYEGSEEAPLASGEITSAKPPVSNPSPVKQETVTPPSSEPLAAAAGAAGTMESQGHYARLPNPLAGPTASGDQLSPEQETRWRNGLSHPFNYQKFKAVQEARQSRLKGSEFILNDALAQPKFWTRMEALLGMAELGQEIDGESMQTAIGDARPSLVANYFRRFTSSSEEAAQHVMRTALRAAQPEARLVIVDNLTRYRGPINDLYLLAASRDTDLKVQARAARALAEQPLSEEIKAQYEQYQSGALTTETKPQSVPGKPGIPPRAASGSDPGATPELSPIDVKDMKVEELPSEVNVEEVYYLDGEGSKNGATGQKGSETPAP